MLLEFSDGVHDHIIDVSQLTNISIVKSNTGRSVFTSLCFIGSGRVVISDPNRVIYDLVMDKWVSWKDK